MSLARVQLGSKAAFGTSGKKIQKPKNLRSDCRCSYVDTSLTKGHGLRALERERDRDRHTFRSPFFLSNPFWKMPKQQEWRKRQNHVDTIRGKMIWYDMYCRNYLHALEASAPTYPECEVPQNDSQAQNLDRREPKLVLAAMVLRCVICAFRFRVLHTICVTYYWHVDEPGWLASLCTFPHFSMFFRSK